MENNYPLLCTIIYLIFIVLVIYFAAFSPKKMKRKKIIAIAEQDYQKSRGKHHLDQLVGVSGQLLKRHKKQKNLCNKDKRLVSKLLREKDNQLNKKLETQIVEQHFQEIKGIGSGLSQRVLKEVFNGRLNSLRNAILVNGVGDERQEQINKWVNIYKKQATIQMESNFPGKMAILSKYDKKIRSAEIQHEESKNTLKIIQGKVDKCLLEIDKLNKIKPSNFVDAYSDQTETNEDLNYFIKGVFGEWETIPSWYKELLEGDYV